MNTKNISIGALVAVVVVLGVLVIKQPTVVTVTKTDVKTVEIPASKGGQVVVPAPVVNVPAPVVNVSVPEQSYKVGAVPSTDITENKLSLGGVQFVTERKTSLVSASTTVCWLKSPAATSTLVVGGIKFNLATTSAVNVGLSNSSTPYASSSASLGLDTVGASAAKAIIASTTSSARVFAANQYFVVKMDTGEVTNNAPTGVCEATWMVF